MKQGLKYAVLALGPIALIVGIIIFVSGGGGVTADSLLYYNVITGDTERVDMDEAAVSVRFDDQQRQSLFVVVPDEAAGGETGDLYIRDRDRATLDKFIADGKLNADDLKVDLETYRILN